MRSPTSPSAHGETTPLRTDLDAIRPLRALPGLVAESSVLHRVRRDESSAGQLPRRDCARKARASRTGDGRAQVVSQGKRFLVYSALARSEAGRIVMHLRPEAHRKGGDVVAGVQFLPDRRADRQSDCPLAPSELRALDASRLATARELGQSLGRASSTTDALPALRRLPRYEFRTPTRNSRSRPAGH